MAITVRIQLTTDLPIAPVHGCVKGKEFTAEYRDTYLNDNGIEMVINERGKPVKFAGDAGAEVVAFLPEYKVIT
jgi:hypothetical protein